MNTTDHKKSKHNETQYTRCIVMDNLLNLQLFIGTQPYRRFDLTKQQCTSLFHDYAKASKVSIDRKNKFYFLVYLQQRLIPSYKCLKTSKQI